MLNIIKNDKESKIEAEENAPSILTDLTFVASSIINQLNEEAPEFIKGKINFYDIFIKGMIKAKE